MAFLALFCTLLPVFKIYFRTGNKDASFPCPTRTEKRSPPSPFLGHLLRDDLINPVKMSVRPSDLVSMPYVRTSTIKLNAATNQIVVFVKVDETFTMVWLSRSSEVRVKVTCKNDDFQILSPPPFFNQSKKFPAVSDTRPKYLKSLGPDFWISS